ncbi:MAG: MFS transporter [Holosporaceae bacterium]
MKKKGGGLRSAGVLLNNRSFPFQLYLGLMASLGVVVTMASVPSLPQMTEYFGCPYSLSGWTVTSAMLGAMACQFFWGPFSDHFGRKNALYVGCALAAVSSFVCYLAPSIESVLVGRFFQGFSAGAGLIVVRALCRDLYDGVYLNRMIAFVLTVIPFSAGVAPSLGDVLVQSFGWNMPFLFLTICSLLLLGATPFFLRGHKQSRVRISFLTILASCRLFLQDPITMWLSFVSAMIYMCFFIFIPSSPWIFYQFFDLQALDLSIALFAFPFGTFCGGFFQSTWGWRFSSLKVSFWCWMISLLSLALNLGMLYFAPHPIFYIGCMMFFGGSMSAFNAISMAYIMKRHYPRYSGNLSSFLGVAQTFASAVGAFVAAYVLSPFYVVALILLFCFIAFSVCLFLLFSLEGAPSLKWRFLFSATSSLQIEEL